MQYTYYDELCENLNKVIDQKISKISHVGGDHIGIHLTGHQFPISINESEFNFIRNFIVDNNLKNGFELSTGTGISTISIGYGFKQTDGHLITLDSYYEELNGISINIPVLEYDDKTIKSVKEKSIAYNFINNASKFLNINENIDIQVGWSPVDSIQLIKNRNKLLDFIFLDCPKNDNEFERDISSLKPYVNMNKYVIFVHDTHVYTQKSFDLVKKLFNIEMIQIFEYFIGTEYYSKCKYPLAMISNIK